ncbi:MAG TPA: ClpX C4-type zinc finger protein [Myxococcota bacterium]|nr:ClpX C4-type zinc finger protein [Myxococcota bacterium]HRY94364.1 ClpX C4-type zinc finger protein [Myxococcota bacterium]HSA24056.1 ClpX C4-type zinc finger protein [Myxococcota bacterium]
MSDAGVPHCPICGGPAPAATPVAGVGALCQGCLLGGRFFGSTGAPSLQAAAEQVLAQSPAALEPAARALERAEELAAARRFEEARGALLSEAQRHLAERPLLASHLAFRALRLPGPSAEVYVCLGRAAKRMDCAREAVQHLKTAGWLAQKFEDRALVEAVVAELEPLAPDDGWLPRARGWLAPAQPPPADPPPAADPPAGSAAGLRCGFCGRPAGEAGALVEGPAAAICEDCLERLAGRRRPS